MTKKTQPGVLVCAVALALAALGAAGCSPTYHLVGNRHWSSPAPQPRDAGLNLPPAPSTGPYGKGPTMGNTSFARGG